MFSESIITPISPLTSQYVEKMIRPEGERDLTLTMLGLVCFKPRVENYRGIRGAYKNYSDNWDALVNIEIETKTDIEFNYFTYRCYRSPEESEEIKHAYEYLAQMGFVHKESVENIIKSKFSLHIDVMYNTKYNSAVVITDNGSMELYHLILSWLPLYYPNIYTDGVNKNSPEIKVLAALSKQTSASFKEKMAEALSVYRQEFYQEGIALLIREINNAKIRKAEQKVNESMNYLANVRQQLLSAIDAFNEARIECEGMKALRQSEESENELISYISNNNKIMDLYVVNSVISFIVPTTLMQFSTDAWQIFVQNGDILNGPYGEYTPVGVFANKENRTLFLNSIFSEDAQFEVKIIGNYSLDINRFVMRTNRNFVYDNTIYKNYLPNPHLKIFGCLGQYERRVAEALSKGDIITAMELSVYSAGSVDLDETHQTFKPFIGWILRSKNKILRRKDGVDMTPEEAMVWLIDQQKGNEE